MTPEPGVEPEPHWWEASALTPAPSLLILGMETEAFRFLSSFDSIDD